VSAMLAGQGRRQVSPTVPACFVTHAMLTCGRQPSCVRGYGNAPAHVALQWGIARQEASGSLGSGSSRSTSGPLGPPQPRRL